MRAPDNELMTKQKARIYIIVQMVITLPAQKKTEWKSMERGFGVNVKSYVLIFVIYLFTIRHLSIPSAPSS